MSDEAFDPTKLGPSAAMMPANTAYAVQDAGSAEALGPRAVRQTITGANYQSTSQGWNTEFLAGFQSSYRKSLEDGTALDYFRNKNNGIALWDDPDEGIRFGDVFYGGEKVENIYDAYGQEFADGVMGQMVLSATEQANGVSVASRRKELTADARTRRAAGTSEDERFYLQQQEFQEDVQDEKDSWDQGTSDFMTVLGGIGGGALAGGGIGTLFGGPVGTAIGVGVGAVTGGIGAWMNRDEIQDIYARNEIQAERAEEEGTGLGGFGVRMQQWGTVAAQMTNPLGNVVHGLAEEAWGNQGDGQSAYYALDENGELKRDWWWTAADIGAAVTSGIGSFGAKVPAAVFQAQMGLQVAGQVEELAATGGKTFDSEVAEYDSIFYDADGDFSAGNALAGIGSIGIDAVQLTAARGLLRAAGAGGRAGSKLEGSADIFAKGEVLSGVRFVQTANGLKVRMTAASWVPSELVQYGTTRVMAAMSRGGAERAAGAITTEELYRTALKLQNSSKISTRAMINAMGEGAEEGVQAMLDPLSHDKMFDGQDVLLSTLMGAAAGAGMTIGSSAGMTTTMEREFADMQKATSEAGLTGFPTDIADWRNMPGPEKETWRNQVKLQTDVKRILQQDQMEERALTEMLSEPMQSAQVRAVEKMVQAAENTAGDGRNRQVTITEASPTLRDHQAQMSLLELESSIREQAMAVQDRLQRMSEDDKRRPRLEQMANLQLEVLRFTQGKADEYYRATGQAVRDRVIDEVNSYFKDQWEGISTPLPSTADDVMKEARRVSIDKAIAASVFPLRWPLDNPASMAVYSPVVSGKMSLPVEPGVRRGQGDGSMEITLASTQAQGADFDGDMYTKMATVLMDQELYLKLRRGAFYRVPTQATGEVGSGDTVGKTSRIAISVNAQETRHIELAALILNNVMDTSDVRRKRVFTMLNNITDTLEQEFPWATEQIKSLRNDLQRGDAKAKTKFYNRIVEAHESRLASYQARTNANPWFVVNTTIRHELQAARDDISRAEATDVSKLIKQGTFLTVKATSDQGYRWADRAATIAQSVWLLLRGDNMFRKWQKLNYSKIRSNQEFTDTERAAIFEAFSEYSQQYAATSSGMLDPKAESVMLPDKTLQNTYNRAHGLWEAMRRDLGENSPSFPVFMNMMVPRFEIVNGEPLLKGKQSVAQWILRETAAKERREAGVNITDEMNSRLLKYEGARRPSQAFMHIFGALPAAQVLEGIDVEVFGENTTLNEVYELFINASPRQRALMKRQLQEHASYLRGPGGEINIPYIIEGPDAADNVTQFQAVVDAVMDAANHELTYDGKVKDKAKEVTGRIADSSNTVTKKTRAALAELWRVWSQPDTKVDRKNRAALEAEVFGYRSADWIAAYLDTLPPEARVLAIDNSIDTRGEGRVRAARWILDVLAADTVEEGEMILWRNIRNLMWDSKGAHHDKDGNVKGRSYYDLDDRWDLLRYRLAQPGNEPLMAQFLKHQQDSKDVYEFLSWVNDEANLIRQADEAPYTIWNSDISELQPSARPGALQVAMPSAQQRENLTRFYDAAMQYGRRMAQLIPMEKADDATLARLETAQLVGDADPSAAGLYKTLQTRLETIRKVDDAVGPSSFLTLLVGSLLMPASAVDKGSAVGHAAQIGAADIQRFMRQFGTVEEARLNSLSSNSLEQVVRNPHSLMNAMDLMDSTGRVIHWPGLDADTLIRLYKDHKNRPLLQQIYSKSAYEVIDGGRVVRRSFTSGSLTELVANTVMEDTLFNDGIANDLKYLSALDAYTPDHDVLKYVQRLLVALTSAESEQDLDAERAERLSASAIQMAAQILKTAAAMPEGAPPDIPEVTVTINSERVNVKPKSELERIRLDAREVLRKRTARTSFMDATEIEALESAVISAGLRGVAPETLLDNTENARQILGVLNALNDNTKGRIKTALGLQKFDAIKDDTKWLESTKTIRLRILDFVNNHGTSMYAPSGSVLERVRDAQYDRGQFTRKISRSDWVELSFIAQHYALMDEVAVTTPGQAASGLNMMLEDPLKYFDPSFAFLVDDLIGPDSELLKQARQMAQDFNQKPIQRSQPGELTELLQNTLLSPGRFGELSEPVAVHMQQTVDWVTTSGAGLGIPTGGMVPHHFVAAEFATKRTFDEPDEGLLSNAVIPASVLLNERSADADTPPHKMVVTRPGGASGVQAPPTKAENVALLDGRFASRVVIRDGAGTVVADSTADRSAATARQKRMHEAADRAMLRFDSPRASHRYRAVNQSRLLQAVRTVADEQHKNPNTYSVEVEFFHPDDMTADLANNLYFEGTLGEGDNFTTSLGAAWLLLIGGIDQKASAAALQALKKNQAALRRAMEVSVETKRALEAGWESDFMAMIDRKVDAVMAPGTAGGDTIEPQYRNAIRKILFRRHLVRRPTQNGELEVFSAEQVREMQAEGEDFTGAELVMLSDTAEARMHGNVSDFDPARADFSTLTLNQMAVTDWTGKFTEEHQRRLPNLFRQTSDELFNGRMVLPSKFQQLSDTVMLPAAMQQKLANDIALSYALASDVARLRIKDKAYDDLAGTRAADRIRDKVTGRAVEADLERVFNSLGIPFNTETKVLRAVADERATKEAQFQQERIRQSLVRIYHHNPPQGALDAKSVLDLYGVGDLENAGAVSPNWIVEGDVVIIDLDEFDPTDSKGLATVLARLTMHRATIHLATRENRSFLLREGRSMLASRWYTPIPGGQNVLVPMAPEKSHATQQAIYSNLLEMGSVSMRNLQLILQSPDAQGEENTGQARQLKTGTLRLRARNTIPVLNQSPHRPVPPKYQDHVKRRLTGLVDELVEQNLKQDKEYRQLVERGLADQALRREQELEKELRRAISKVESSLDVNGRYSNTDLRIGDIIPLYDDLHDTLVLYRHGMKRPDEAAVAEALDGELKTALYLAERDSSVGALTGQILDWADMGAGGWQAILSVPAQQLGGKFFIDVSGFKIVVQANADDYEFEYPDLFPGVSIDFVVNASDIAGKTGDDGAVHTFQDAFLYNGVDFRADVAKVLFGTVTTETMGNVAYRLGQIKKGFKKYQDPETVSQMVRGLLWGQKVDLTRIMDPDVLSQDDQDALKAVADRYNANQDPETLITLAMLFSLTHEEVLPEHLLSSSGIGASNARETGAYSWRMPSLFTQIFDLSRLDSPLRTHVVEKLNSVIPNPRTAADGRQLGWRWRNDLRVQVSAEDPRDNTIGRLQFSEVILAPTNPSTQQLAADRRTNEGALESFQQIMGMTSGAKVVPDDSKIKEIQKLIATAKLSTPQTAVEYARSSSVTAHEPTVRLSYQLSQKEQQYAARHQETLDQYRQELDFSDWDDAQRKLIDRELIDLGAKYGFEADDLRVFHTWIRQVHGNPTISKRQLRRMTPEQLQAAEAAASITYDDAHNALELIAQNLANGWVPVMDGANPQMSMHDLAKLKKVTDAAGTFKLRTDVSDKTKFAQTWDDWMHVALAIGDVPRLKLDPMRLTAVDAMRHTFMDSNLLFIGAPTSVSELRAQALTDETVETLISLSPYRSELLRADEVPEVVWMADSVAEKVQREERRKAYRWRKAGDGSVPMGTTAVDLVQHGVRLVDENNKMIGALRIGTHLRAINALLQPALWTGAILEGGIQSTLENITNVLMGQSVAAGGLAQALDLAVKAGTFGQASISMISQEDRQLHNDLIQMLGSNNKFITMFFNEFKMDQSGQPNSRAERWTKQAAEFAGRFQDPTYGTSQNTLAKRYMEGVLGLVEQLAATRDGMDPRTVMLNMMADPTYIKRQMPGIHKFAVNRILNIKCIKQTTASVIWRGFLDPLVASPSPVVSTLATVLGKWPYMFFTYGSNTLVRMLGLQGVDAWIAASLQGRKYPRVVQALRKGLYGAAGLEMDTNEDAQVMDFQDVFESADLAHSFVKSGVTLTGLFAAVAIAGAAGLTGENEEDRKRRAMAKYQGAAYLYDPTDIQNDFRNLDAIFLDKFPGLNSWFRVEGTEGDGEEARALANMGFLTKQVLSPVMGILRFFDSGNPNDILWGFQDAVTSLPLMSTMGWDDAAKTYSELMAMSADASTNGGPEGMTQSFRYALNAVMTLERFLFENNFANQMYQAADKFDRDPWTMVDRNGTDEIVTDRTGEPVKSGVLEDYKAEDGTIQQRYKQYTTEEALINQYAEKRWLFGMVHSLVAFQTPTLSARKDMAVKTRRIPSTEITADQAVDEIDWDLSAEGVVTAMWKGAATPESLNLEGFYMDKDQRTRLSALLKEKIITEGLALYDNNEYLASQRFWRIWNGPDDNPDVPGLYDIVWSQGAYEGTIPWHQSTTYAQLNTTYTMGPDGSFWATGVKKGVLDELATMLGLPRRFLTSGDTGLGTDSRINTIDEVRNANLGLRGLIRLNDSYEVPDPTDDLIDAIGKVEDAVKDLDVGGGSNSGYNNGYGYGYGSRGWYSYGGSGGSGGSYFSKMNAPERSTVPYTGNTPNIGNPKPYVRRASIRRERTSSQRGRLKPWQ